MGSVKTQKPSASPKNMPARRRVALVAHDNRKADLLEWARYNRASLKAHDLVATGTTGKLISKELGLPVTTVESGPLGGDLQIGAMITSGEIDMLDAIPGYQTSPSHWSLSLTTPTSGPCCVWASCGTS